MRPLVGLFGILVLAIGAAPVRADALPDPLRLIPDKVDLLLKVEKPGQLVEAVMALDVFKKFQELDAVHELYESTNSRRFFQLVGYFEKQLNAHRVELLDRLAGGGMVLAVKFKPEPAALLVVQSKDAEFLQRFFKVALQITEQELSRLESKDKLVRHSHRGIQTLGAGKDFAMAVVGSALVLSNSAAALNKAIDLQVDGPSGSMARAAMMAETCKLLPPGPAAWLWLNLGLAHEDPGLKAVFDQVKDNGIVPIFSGGLFNVAARAPYLCMGLYQKHDEFDLALRFPRGKEGMPEAVALHLPEDARASLPLLEPAHTIVTASYYLDLATLWDRRAKLLKGPELKGIEELDKKSGFFLGGVKLGKLLQQAGTHQRIVVANQTNSGYKIVPTVRIPAAALVLEMRDPDFARTAETVARAAALLGSFKLDLKLVEEMHAGHKIVGYRFPENGKVPGDEGNLRFNASPCLVKVNNQFVLSSTLELARDLVDVLEKESAAPVYNASTLRVRAHSSGAAAALRSAADQLYTQAILGQALAPATAREQVQALIAFVEQLGSVQMQTHYGANEFDVDFRLILGRWTAP